MFGVVIGRHVCVLLALMCGLLIMRPGLAVRLHNFLKTEGFRYQLLDKVEGNLSIN